MVRLWVRNCVETRPRPEGVRRLDSRNSHKYIAFKLPFTISASDAVAASKQLQMSILKSDLESATLKTLVFIYLIAFRNDGLVKPKNSRFLEAEEITLDDLAKKGNFMPRASIQNGGGKSSS